VPLYSWLERFRRDFERLTPNQQRDFLLAVSHFVADLNSPQQFRKGLRVKGVQGAPGIFEMTWADDGRATFHYEANGENGITHIVWRRIGTHDIFAMP
jgi:hypothetical protein